jgi:hypothetical protein
MEWHSTEQNCEQNDFQHNDIQQSDTQHSRIKNQQYIYNVILLFFILVSVIQWSVILVTAFECHSEERHGVIFTNTI